MHVATTVGCYLGFGTRAVTASTSDLLFPGGVEVFKVPQEATHIAVLQSAAISGVMSFSAMA